MDSVSDIPEIFHFLDWNSAGAGGEMEEDGLFVAGFPEKWGVRGGLFQAFPSGRILGPGVIK